MWQKKEWKERNGKEYKEREGVKSVFDGGRDVWDVFHRNSRPSVKEMIKMSKSWKSGENKRREMFSKKPETVLAERKGRHLPGGARHSPGCSEICFDLAMVWCFDVWWFDDKEEWYDCSGDGSDAGIFWWGTLKFLKVGNSSKKTNQQKMIFPKLLFPRTFLAAQTWWLQPDVQSHTHHLLCQTCRGFTMF